MIMAILRRVEDFKSQRLSYGKDDCVDGLFYMQYLSKPEDCSRRETV